MKVTNTLLVTASAVFCMLAPFTGAQCPQICDSNLENVAIGPGALSNDTGTANTAVGLDALQTNTIGYQNVAVGDGTLYANTRGTYNTALGSEALGNNTTASFNTAVGGWSMVGTGSPSTGTYDTAVGAYSLENITTGSYNTATGGNALQGNGSGSSNTATGYNALSFNYTGSFNTATGRGALYKNTGSNNTADGYQALNKNTVGIDNVATGYEALFSNTSGITNTAVGAFALQNNLTGGGNIAIGFSAGTGVTSGSNNIDIANNGANESSTIRIGSTNQTNTYIAGISGVTVASGLGVIVDSTGHLGTSTSSARYKENIQPMDRASEAILNLQPVTFRYRKELDPKAIRQFGLVAEQVEQVDPDLVARDDKGKPYSVRYEAVNAMLLNEFLKEHRKIEQLESAVADLQAAVKEQTTEIKTIGSQGQ